MYKLLTLNKARAQLMCAVCVHVDIPIPRYQNLIESPNYFANVIQSKLSAYFDTN